MVGSCDTGMLPSLVYETWYKYISFRFYDVDLFSLGLEALERNHYHSLGIPRPSYHRFHRIQSPRSDGTSHFFPGSFSNFLSSSSFSWAKFYFKGIDWLSFARVGFTSCVSRWFCANFACTTESPLSFSRWANIRNNPSEWSRKMTLAGLSIQKFIGFSFGFLILFPFRHERMRIPRST